MYQFAKQVAKAILPWPYRIIAERWGGSAVEVRITRTLLKGGFDYRIMDGPFRGMHYLSEAVGSALIPKWLGTYELELWPAVTRCIERSPRTIVDIGCAEGYYAVGFAVSCPMSRVMAYDIDPKARELCGKLARLNGVEDRVTVAAECSPQVLNQLDLDDALIVCDCEGAELDVLKADQVPSLARACLLVELHDIKVPGLSAQFLPRFAETHDIELFNTQVRQLGTVPVISRMSAPDQNWAMLEFRGGGMQWAYMTPKNQVLGRQT